MRASLLGVMLALAAPAAADGTLYKWVDERGVVNYGDAPPEGAKKLTKVDESRTNVTVVPGLDKETIDNAREREMRARIERLERELQELRERESHKTATPAAAGEQTLATSTDYLVPLVVVRRQPPHPVHLPVHGRPVQKSPPLPAQMRLEQRP